MTEEQQQIQRVYNTNDLLQFPPALLPLQLLFSELDKYKIIHKRCHKIFVCKNDFPEVNITLGDVNLKLFYHLFIRGHNTD